MGHLVEALEGSCQMADSIVIPLCQKCGSAMVVRHRRTDGEPFIGCTRFPQCRAVLKIALPPASEPTANPALSPSRIAARPDPKAPATSGAPTQDASRFPRLVKLALVFDAISAACAIGVLVAANGRVLLMLPGAVILAITALSAVSAPFVGPTLAIRVAWRVLVLALIAAFAAYGLVPVSRWLGQVIGHELIQEMPTMHLPTPSTLP